MVLIERDPARKSRVFFAIRPLNLSSVIPALSRNPASPSPWAERNLPAVHTHVGWFRLKVEMTEEGNRQVHKAGVTACG